VWYWYCSQRHFVFLLAHGDSVAGILRHQLCLGGYPEAMTSGEQNSWRARYDRGERLGHKTPEESSVNITVCNYNITHLQENPQRLGWGSWRDVLYYILGLHSLCQGQCDWSYTSVFKYYFSDTWTGLGCSGASLCSSRVEIELSPYIKYK